MGSNCDGNLKAEIEESNGSSGKNTKVPPCPLDVSTSRRTLIGDGKPRRWSISALPDASSRFQLLKFGSPSAKFKKMAEDRDEVSRSVTSSSNGSSHNFRERISGVLHRKIDWSSLMNMGKEWIRNPINMALFVWILVVAVSGAILFMVMTGMLNHALPKKSQRDAWFEVNNQILNGLFTLMCLYQHPKRFYHLVLLCRWKHDDITKLRKAYCKDGTYKPNEWMHIMVVVILLHLNCFAQYALCGLNVGYRRSERPPIGVAICISAAIGAPAVAGLYTILSPLGKDYNDSNEDEENQLKQREEGSVNRRFTLERRYSFASASTGVGDGMVPVSDPQWSGGILDIWDDISLAYLSLFCTFCVFGWNMERVGFGNMYVHIATFILFCLAPFFIFNLAAVNIDNETVREALGISGILLCVFGLLYGGFWRIQMRKRFKLPSYNFCFGRAAIADCALWLCCCWCSLAQEVRTANSYEIVEDKFCQRKEEKNMVSPNLVSPLPREDGVFDPRFGLGSSPKNISGASSPSPSRFWKEAHSPNVQTPREKEEVKSDVALTPPSPLSIHREA
ncbi:putative PLAC8 motif-containing protein [Arabidopsis thaliana]|jgi:Cys-rich protein (TIGR01571 family)|uniref:PLAC8 family protein n=4 Tax=Arabidopsis TaxID=3701 RepID=Q8W4N1_ARATH|nr:PLAC8 family protein [Arabidopsis thaliana]KAG7624779.1 PLAC8 motif-containing protein [Arabidopsis thaliana x Arabidopsis arenosa]KAG7630796.1 PLAC8 motif-containing protein [Arabidopsis suecica]AAL32543.1 Unknown protein [Arabidopsis thaliana]AAN15438.1 Unknown protein [Arabidopsis thaliana]AEE74987.1 PLAC8 family protein [Arabidopsis thaliana]|eukprot:NP_187709.5 PLAC8 family protein [Arabidopsis thaliana]